MNNKHTMNMKKYMILAAVALVASAACTKVEDTTPSHKISFEVANYVAQTKAEQATNAELGGSFTTNAWFTNGDNVKKQFMTNETITWNSTVAGQWAPSREYYWPKTGYIDFYSYDGVPTPSSPVAEGSLVYTDKTITATDNILVADAAFHQTQNSETYQIDGASVKGVPTLFRHMLAKIQFKVKLQTANATPNTKWDVTILNADAKLSNIVILNTGTLTLSNSYAGTTPTTQVWTNANTTYPNVGWVANAGTETISTDTPALTLAAGATENVNGYVDLIELRTVMPQVLGDDAVFTLNYNVKATYGSEAQPYLDENRDFTVKINTIKNASSVAITEWDMNQIITYNVIIDPVGEQILFDPAVEEWDETQTGTINVPQA